MSVSSEDSRNTFADPVVIVTGGATGIGRACVAALLAQSTHVVVVGLPGPDLDSMAPEAHVVAGDASDPTVATTALEAALQRYGRLDSLIQCAGIGRPGSIVETDARGWSLVMQANLETAVTMSRICLPALVDTQGTMVLVSSLAGTQAVPGAGAYTVSKHAVIGLARSLATDFGPAGVRVNAVCPGQTRTAMFDGVMRHAADQLGVPVAEAYRRVASVTPSRRCAEPSDIADVILFLAGPLSRAVNGAVLMADGGASATDLSMSRLAGTT